MVGKTLSLPKHFAKLMIQSTLGNGRVLPLQKKERLKMQLEILRLMKEKDIEIMCMRETKCKRRNISSLDVQKHAMNIKISDRIMSIKLEVNGVVGRIVSCFAPWMECTQEEH